MAAKLLLGGYGGQYTSESITATAAGAVGADTIDVSRNAQFSLQMSAVANPGAATLQVQQTFELPVSSSSDWANLGSAAGLVQGSVLRFPVTNGPYGVIRLVVTDPAAAATVTSVIVGMPVQVVP